ncbi:short-chain dehydrogenase [Caldibacillus lycopersici]|uniref:Short-chain dehydrogenase n=1 Tax=Perspicuibacillus lycopersici TaxID=1325689 RepID=A0AAE3IUR4_9BACI|nr:short-chain dehydrogenase [Perspicuibacillus lycopersici]MCU9615005.1 short-chain dehydrogenase [Perspicuibacillus lycopersici]
MTHALVIGGTGMLANTSLWLASQGYHVSVIGRNPSKMESLISKAIDHSRITPVIVDYRDKSQLRKKLRETMEQNGQITLVVAWIHSDAEQALQTIVNEVSHQNDEKWKLFHVLGSSKNLSEMKATIRLLDSICYHQVQLGFVMESGYSRWLTNEEISQGVIDAIQNEKLLNTVGTVEPWEKRPFS